MNKKFFVIYRDNTLYATYVPHMVAGLDVIDTFIVPRGTEFKSVREAAVAAAEQAKAKGANTLLTDVTCNNVNAIYTPGEEWPTGYLFPGRTIILDYMFQRQIEANNPANTVADNFNWFARQITRGRTVKSVLVVKSEIADHDFAGRDHSLRRRDNEGAAIWIVNQLLDLYPEAAVQVVETLKQALEFASDPETLLVLDRHCGIKEVMSQDNGWYNSLDNWPHPSMLYLLPFETCALNLQSRDELDFQFDIAAMRQELVN